jgi:glycosyltransferase involved in cell wall biosynthesis
MKIGITMPVYNEEQSIADLIAELDKLSFFQKIIVVNDDSTDKTAEILSNLNPENLFVVQNAINKGHGPSTLVGLEVANKFNLDVIVSVDGDGHFDPKQIVDLTKHLIDENFDLVEGNRTHRDDPWFRKLSSKATRILVQIRCGEAVVDANTPIRAYKASVLKNILKMVPSDNYPIPNLFISAVSRRLKLSIGTFDIDINLRATNAPLGSTWNQKHKNIPTPKYIRFCINATKSWYFKRSS